MRISLVTSTLNRPGQIRELLDSLQAQSRQPDQIIIVDQSDNDGTKVVVEKFINRLPIVYIKDPRRGLSKGRNLGLRQLVGEIVAFPDDDCVYPPDAIARAIGVFSAEPETAIYTGMSITPRGEPSQGRWGKEPHALNRFNIWVSQTSYTTFYRSDVVARAGGFNEDLGVGADSQWGAGEETELMLRALAMGATGRYDPELKIAHPEPLAVFDQAALNRGKRYNRGFGRVLRMGKYPLWFVAYMSLRPLLGATAALLRGRVAQARYRSIACRERLLGWADSGTPVRQSR